ncbi:uncharacterized protein LOC133806518 [Humulus lupulus]|uniref:uncharacterized protein LOC133806518 n=1 Tax=Humulus lupulus TaxID=3486 RepID=UPI002B40DA1F|nr:uncharacterized protein LOC133806518 [Humulus lupulus]
MKEAKSMSKVPLIRYIQGTNLSTEYDKSGIFSLCRLQMEKVAQDLRSFEKQQGNLCKTFEELHSQAFSALKELKNYFSSNQCTLQSIFVQLVEREKQIFTKEKEVEAQEFKFNEEYEERLQRLVEIDKLNEEYHEKIAAKNKSVEELNSLIQKISVELEKEVEYNRIVASTLRNTERLASLENSILQKSEENQRLAKKFRDVTDLKESRLNEAQRLYEKCMKDLDLKEEQLKVLEQKIKLKEEMLDSIKSSIKDRSCELELKRKQLEYEEAMESKLEELDLIEKNVNEIADLLKENSSYASAQKLLEEQLCQLQQKEIEFEKKVNAFNLRQQEFESAKKSAWLGVKDKNNMFHSVKIERWEHTHTSASHQFGPTNEKSLLEQLNECLKKYDLACHEIFVLFQVSSDPAKLVLEAMQRIYCWHSYREDKEIVETNMRKTSILLSALSMKASAKISPQVTQEASKLASDWHAKMKVAKANCLEVLCFLQFVVSFSLTSSFDVNTLHSILDIVGLNGQASRLLPAMCTANKAPDVETIQNLILKKEIIHAVALVCELKLTDKFSPVTLLVEYIKDAENYTSLVCRGRRSIEAKKKATVKEITVLKAVKKCIEDCNLQSVFPKSQFYQVGQRLVSLEEKLQLYRYGPNESLRKRKNDDSTASQQIKIKYSQKK